MELDRVMVGDCLDVMAEMDDNCISTVITDPPYGLSGEPDMVEVLTHWLAGDDYEHRGGGFMGKSWDSFVPGPAVWREVYRVMKPGGTLLAFGGTRTNDLLSIAIRLAGFQKFDEIDYYYGGLPPQMAWLTGQGFPKSLDVSKQLDKQAGAERRVIGKSNRCVGPSQAISPYYGSAEDWANSNNITAPATEAAAQWSGYGTGLKPAHEVILCFYKPREGSYASNALRWGVAGLWIDGGRVATGESISVHGYPGRGNFGVGGKSSYSPKPMQPPSYQENNKGRFPANLIFSHADGCRRRGTRRVRGANHPGSFVDTKHDGRVGGATFQGRGAINTYVDPDGFELVDDWECVSGCPVRSLGEQTGERRSAEYATSVDDRGETAPRSGFIVGNRSAGWGYYDRGTAARFFYQAKASRRERNLGCQDVYWRKDKAAPVGFVRVSRDEWEALPEKQRARGNIHPTVKPLGVVEYLCKLTRSPTGGVVFDPFCGTGTTALGAIKTGRRWLCCDNQADYVYLANLRIEALRAEMPQMELSL